MQKIDFGGHKRAVKNLAMRRERGRFKVLFLKCCDITLRMEWCHSWKELGPLLEWSGTTLGMEWRHS